MKRWRSEGGSQRKSTIVACCQLIEILWHSSHDANHLSLSVNRCQPMSPGSNFVAKIKPRTFTAVEIRHKIMRKMSKHQKLTAKC